MRHLLVAAAVAAVATLAACGGGTYTDDTASYGGSGGGNANAGGGKRCTGTLSKGDWCARCSNFVAANTSGRCANCNGAVSSQDCCVRVTYRCTECAANHAEPCALNDSYQCCSKLDVRARLVCACGSACSGDACAKCKQAGGCKKGCAH